MPKSWSPRTSDLRVGDEREASGQRREVERAGEAAAVAHLQARGLRVIARDWRCRLGQLDLICEDAGVLVAVEVKARRGDGFGLPQEAVDWRKQAKLRSLVDAYRLASGRRDQACRIDVVAVRLDRQLRLVSCEHIRNAVGG
jgi:putative endonuclease